MAQQWKTDPRQDPALTDAVFATLLGLIDAEAKAQARWYVGRGDVEDVSQEVLAVSWQRGEIRAIWLADRVPLRKYAYKVTKLVILRFRQRRGRHERLKERYQAHLMNGGKVNEDPEHWSAGRDFGRVFIQALERMPERPREAFLGVFLEGRSYEQQAAAMGVKKHSIEQHVTRALAELWRTLNEHYPGISAGWQRGKRAS